MQALLDPDGGPLYEMYSECNEDAFDVRAVVDAASRIPLSSFCSDDWFRLHAHPPISFRAVPADGAPDDWIVLDGVPMPPAGVHTKHAVFTQRVMWRCAEPLRWSSPFVAAYVPGQYFGTMTTPVPVTPT